MSLRQMENVSRTDAIQQLIHFLLAVAGGLTHDQIGEIGVGTLVRQGEAIAGLDQGAQILGQMGFCRGNGLIAHTAKADADKAGSIQNFSRGKGAENARHSAAILLDLLDPQEACLTGIGKFLKLFGKDKFHLLFLLLFSDIHGA